MNARGLLSGKIPAAENDRTRLGNFPLRRLKRFTAEGLTKPLKYLEQSAWDSGR